MKLRDYLSEVSPWWTIERQEEALGPSTRGAVRFIDRLDEKQRRAHRPESLTGRATMLRATTRKATGERFRVASYAVLGWDWSDVAGVVALIEERGGTLESIDEAGQPCTEETWKAARTKSRLEGSALRGSAVAARKRRETSLERWALIRDRWHLKEHSGPSLLAEAGLTRNTVNAINNGKTREVLIAEHERRMKRRKT